ncbi:hypothetical protein [Dysgonomonas sp. 520]|uniref:hypothetical protein n=1 Tax=Dysgonomonas sp. 520 TaxID=2302931 RepID=UPI0013CFE19B|nr:hypothetical protein [Dysgonomonas sp. 520]NDW10675.1 hypothetical protein [Dysgonomonas sp. 520]
MGKHTKNKADTGKKIYEVYKDLVGLMPVPDIVKKYAAEWDIGESTIRAWYIPKAYELAEENLQKNTAKILSRQIATISKIGAEAIANGRYREALQATEQLNKLSNLYTEKIELEHKGNVINLQFAGFDLSDNNDEEEPTDNEI